MLEVCCVHVPAGTYKNGGQYDNIYTADYVNKLAAMVRRNLTVPHRFTVITQDERQPYASGVRVVKDRNNWLPKWQQLEVFRPDLWERDRQILYFDQDVYIIDNIDFFAEPYHGNLAALRDCDQPFLEHWKDLPMMLNSGIELWRPNEATDHLYDFYVTPEGKRRGNPMIFRDQQFTQYQFKERDYKWDILQDMFPGKIMGYKNEYCKLPHDEVAVVTCAGFPKPHQINDERLNKHWSL